MNLRISGKWAGWPSKITVVDTDTGQEFTRIRSLGINCEDGPKVVLELVPTTLEVDLELEGAEADVRQEPLRPGMNDVTSIGEAVRRLQLVKDDKT